MFELVYFSNVTKNTQRFMQKLNWPGVVHQIPVKGTFEAPLPKPYILITPSYGTIATGHIPPQVKRFLKVKENRQNCVGVIGAGNRNFGEEFTRAADVTAAKLGIPVLYRFELAGTTEDIEITMQGLKDYQKHLINNPLPFQI